MGFCITGMCELAAAAVDFVLRGQSVGCQLNNAKPEWK
jgi:hypothetical protein